MGEPWDSMRRKEESKASAKKILQAAKDAGWENPAEQIERLKARVAELETGIKECLAVQAGMLARICKEGERAEAAEAELERYRAVIENIEELMGRHEDGLGDLTVRGIRVVLDGLARLKKHGLKSA